MSVDACAFLAGHWTCTIHGGSFEETWATTLGGTMIGHGRLIVDGQTKFMEFLSIEEADGIVTLYIILGAPSQGPKEPVAFTLIEAGPASVVFEREGDDFPTRIQYENQSDGLPCTLCAPNGRTELYDFVRLK